MNQKVNLKDSIVKGNPNLINNIKNGSGGKELVTMILQQVPREVWINGAIAIKDQITKRLDNEQEEKTKITDKRIELLSREINDSLDIIQIEMAKENTNHEIIKMFQNRVDKKELELKEMQGDADGLFKSIKQYITVKSKK